MTELALKARVCHAVRLSFHLHIVAGRNILLLVLLLTLLRLMNQFRLMPYRFVIVKIECIKEYKKQKKFVPQIRDFLHNRRNLYRLIFTTSPGVTSMFGGGGALMKNTVSALYFQNNFVPQIREFLHNWRNVQISFYYFSRSEISFQGKGGGAHGKRSLRTLIPKPICITIIPSL